MFSSLTMRNLPSGLLKKIALLFIALGLLTAYMLQNYRATMIEERRAGAQKLVEHAINLASYYDTKARKDALTKEQAQQYALESIQTAATDKNAYFWIIDNQPKMIMHQKEPALAGEDLRNFKSAAGENPFLEMVEIVRTAGSGFVNYKWPRPDQEDTTPAAKTSYVKAFEPWNWIIGSGIYHTDIEKDFRKVSYFAYALMIAITLVILTFSVLMSKHPVYKP